MDDSWDCLHEADVVAGGVSRDAEVGPLVDDVGLVAVLLDDDEGLGAHLLEPEEETVPEAHPITGGLLLGHDDLVLTGDLTDVLRGDIDDIPLDARGAGGANLAVGGALDLHLQGRQDLQLGPFRVAYVGVEAKDFGLQPVLLQLLLEELDRCLFLLTAGVYGSVLHEEPPVLLHEQLGDLTLHLLEELPVLFGEPDHRISGKIHGVFNL